MSSSKAAAEIIDSAILESTKVVESTVEKFQKQAKVRFRKSNKPGVALPNSGKVDDDVFESFTYSMPADHEIWGNPSVLLKDPKPGYTYGWMDTEDQTATTRVAANLYRLVHKDELKQTPLTRGNTHKGTDEYVHRYRTVLFEMSPAAKLELHDKPAMQAVARLVRREEQFLGDVERTSKGQATGSFTVNKNGT